MFKMNIKLQANKSMHVLSAGPNYTPQEALLAAHNLYVNLKISCEPVNLASSPVTHNTW